MKNRAMTVRQSCDATIMGAEVTLNFDRAMEFSHDANYGADADGRRGMPMDFIERDEAENAEIEFADGKKMPLSDLPQDIREACEAAIKKDMDAQDAFELAGDNSGPDEPDWDDEGD